MPKFAANLSTQFGELPFIERFAAAANAGFRAVEFLFPYDFPAKVIKAELEKTSAGTGAVQHRRRQRAGGRVGRFRHSGP